MFAKDSSKTSGSPEVEVGEVDTNPPFKSVKDAVTFFGEGENPAPIKSKTHSTKGVLPKERKLHLAQEEINRVKKQLKNAETIKGQTFAELETANQTVEDLTQKLKVVCDSKNSAVRETEEVKNRVMQLEDAHNGHSEVDDGSWKLELETVREQYMATIAELDAAKQELRKMHQDCNASTEEKVAALTRVKEAELAKKDNMNKADEVSQEIAILQVSIGQLKLASLLVKEEEEIIYANKDVEKQSNKSRLEELAKKLDPLRKEVNPSLATNLETQLAEKMSEIKALRKEIDSARASDLALAKDVTTELNDAKESLNEVFEGEGSLKTLLAGLELELENVKKEHSELMEKEAETESLAGDLHLRLQRAKYELEAALAEESKVRCASEETLATVHQVRSECENAKSEANEMKKQVEELKRETLSTRITLEEEGKKLEIALLAADEAKAAEDRALDQIKILSERSNAVDASTSDSGAHITISRDEFQFLSRKVEESEMIAELKVAAAMAQVEAVKASENEALKRLEATQKEIDDMKTATKEALKRAEMAETAKKAVEGELRRWREKEQKKAAEATYCILAETQMVLESFPHNYQNTRQGQRDAIESQTQIPEVRQSRKLEKSKTSVARKVLLRNVSGVFPMRRKQVQGGSPYLPGEKSCMVICD